MDGPLALADDCVAARWAPSFAITRERDMRGLRAISAFGFGGTDSFGIPDGVPSIVVAAAVKEGFCLGVGTDVGLENVDTVSG